MKSETDDATEMSSAEKKKKDGKKLDYTRKWEAKSCFFFFIGCIEAIHHINYGSEPAKRTRNLTLTPRG